jgi:hypothetical protein
MYAIKAVGLLRVSAEGELAGLDLYEHGVTANPEYAFLDEKSPIFRTPEVEETSVSSEGMMPAPQEA